MAFGEQGLFPINVLNTIESILRGAIQGPFVLTLSHRQKHFDAIAADDFWKHLAKGEIALILLMVSNFSFGHNVLDFI